MLQSCPDRCVRFVEDVHLAEVAVEVLPDSCQRYFRREEPLVQGGSP
jgi:hypothetical protein